MFEIVQLTKEMTIEELDKQISQPIYFVIGEDGIYRRVRNGIYSSVTKAPKMTHLGKVKEGLTLRCTPVPFKVVWEITSFCKKVYDLHKGEAVALLGYNDEKQDWIWVAPKQETTGGGLSVTYEHDSVVMPEGYRLAGSMHSHCDAPAFQSGTDSKDEYNFDGIHITVGKLGSTPEYDVRMIGSGATWNCDDSDLMGTLEYADFPEELLNNVTKKAPVVYNGVGYGLKKYEVPEGLYSTVTNSWVKPGTLKKDYLPIGTIKAYKGKDYEKTAQGWVEKEGVKTPEQKILNVTKTMISSQIKRLHIAREILERGSFVFSGLMCKWDSALGISFPQMDKKEGELLEGLIASHNGMACPKVTSLEWAQAAFKKLPLPFGKFESLALLIDTMWDLDWDERFDDYDKREETAIVTPVGEMFP